MGDLIEKPMDSKIFYPMLGLLILAMLLLGVVGGEPYFRGQEMADEFKSNCDKRGGLLLESKRMMGTNYQCVEDWNN